MWAKDANGYSISDPDEIKSFLSSNQEKKLTVQGLLSACIMSGREAGLNYGDGGSGVVNIQNNTTKID